VNEEAMAHWGLLRPPKKINWKEYVSEFESLYWNLSAGYRENQENVLTIVCFEIHNSRDSYVAVSVCEAYCAVRKNLAGCRFVPPLRGILLPPLAG
jgi:hypothetical protein